MNWLTYTLALLSLFLPQTPAIPGPGNKGSSGSSITFDVASAITTAAASTSISWSHTVGASAHPVLIVLLEGGSGGACTFNSVSMTSLGRQVDGAGASNLQVFILANPATGAHTVSCTGISSNDQGGASVSFFGVNQGNTVGTTWRTPVSGNNGGGGATTVTITASNAVSGDMVIDGAASFNATLTPDVSQTQTFNGICPGGSSERLASSYKIATGSTVMLWTLGISQFGAIFAFALIPG